MSRSEPHAESPAELAGRIRAGTDAEAETRLIRRYALGVRLVLDRHTRDVCEAEDLFQETFRLAVTKLRAGDLREPAKLPGFLASLARNLATEHYRKVIRRKTDADSEKAEAGSTAAGGQLGELLRSEEAALVRRTLDDLSTARDREILFRFYIAEEDKNAIGAEYDLTSLQFNRVLHRARQRYKVRYLARLAALDGSTATADRHLAPTQATLALIGALVVAGAIVRLLTSQRV